MRTMMVAGPRKLGTSVFAVSLAIDSFFAGLGDGFLVIHGAADGVDSIAAAAAARHGHRVMAYPVLPRDRKEAVANTGEPKKAPLYRTRRMLALEPDLVVAWWDGKSSGTGFTITEARRRNIPVTVFNLNAKKEEPSGSQAHHDL